MSFFKEFKEFAVKGNMIDMAVGIIIGAAFNGVVNTLVNKIILPPISLITSGINFQKLGFVMREAITDETGAVVREPIVLGYGEFIQVMLNFLIVGMVVFMIVRIMNRMRRHAENPADPKAATPKDIELLSKLTGLIEEQNELLRNKK